MRTPTTHLCALLLAGALCITAACSDEAAPSSTSSSGGGAGTSSSTTTSSTSTTTGTGSGGDAEWTYADWAVPGCGVEYAKKPELAFPALEWEECPGAVPGCQRMKKNWPQDSVSGISDPAVRRMPDGYAIGLFLTMQQFESRLVYYSSTGEPEAVYKRGTNSNCFLTRPALSVDGHWVGAQRLEFDPPSRFAFQPRSAPAGQVEMVPFDQLAQFQRGGDELLALQLDFGVGWYIYDRVTGQVHAAPADFTATNPTLTGGSALMLRFHPDLDSPQAWAFSRQTGAFARLIHNDPGYVLRVHADGQDLVWVEAPSPPWPAAGTLMRSPFAATAAGVVPTPVRPMPPLSPTGSGAVGQGYYALGFDGEHILVVRLADGHLWKVAIPPTGDGAYLNHVTHVDATYVFCKTNTHVYRQRLDQLGPGYAANELPP
jgi:hypothetical protein